MDIFSTRFAFNPNILSLMINSENILTKLKFHAFLHTGFGQTGTKFMNIPGGIALTVKSCIIIAS